MDSGHIILSAVQPETVAGRVRQRTSDQEEELIFRRNENYDGKTKC